MHKKKECIAMLLAGGEGKRLGYLTNKLAKPAVYFGGKYRIIDFPLSNCINSDIDTVGVLTQYEPLTLNYHLGNGSAWDLDLENGGLTSLPPFVEKQGGSWYKGTADAISQNLSYIEQFDPEYILILSGDHIYKMDYRLLLNFHKERRSDATISVIEVPWNEASRFGIMNTNHDGEILDFEEKPSHPTSNLASMGVYIFNWSILKTYLLKDTNSQLSSHDFGKDIIPMMLNDNCRLYAYPFSGYWKDVGTVQSYWDANMDLLKRNPLLNLHEDKWKIYSNNANMPPHFIASSSTVSNSLINEGCLIYGNVIHSILFHGVTVKENSSIDHSILMPNVHIGENVKLSKVIVTEGVVIPDHTTISSQNNEILVLTKDFFTETKKAMSR